jgi:hypothetical protein
VVTSTTSETNTIPRVTDTTGETNTSGETYTAVTPSLSGKQQCRRCKDDSPARNRNRKI